VYYDKAILGSAALFGMTADLSLSVVTNASTKPPTVSTTRLSWATSLFYFGMLAGLYPLTFALQRFNLGRILGAVVLLWSLICMLTAAVTTYHGLFAQRFFLGFVESIIPTGFMTIISSYYTQREQSIRQSWWFSSTGLFTNQGRIFLDRITRPGEYDDEQQFAKEEAEVLEDMDDLQRTEYMRAKGMAFSGLLCNDDTD